MNKKYFSKVFFLLLFPINLFYSSHANASTYTKLFDFGGANGENPYNSLIYYNGFFYGTTYNGGANDGGVIFQWDPETDTYTKNYDFSDATGSHTESNLTPSGGKLYGITPHGGSNTVGVIFEWDPIMESYSVEHNFSFPSGSQSFDSLTYANSGKLYGTTMAGGDDMTGTLFEYDPAINTHTNKINMTNSNGATPMGALTWANGKLYGVTNVGGGHNEGVIFEWDPDANIYTKKIDLTAADGTIQPVGSTLAYANGKLFGMAYTGGIHDKGTIFEYDPFSNVFTKKFDFDGTDGAYPQGVLITGPDASKLFGMTQGGGANGRGVIFEWDLDSDTFTKKYDFDGTNGSSPQGSLLLWIDDKFYGMTVDGGINDKGVIFSWDPQDSNDSEDQEENDGSAARKAKITSWKAYQYENANLDKCSKRVKVVIRGKYFAKNPIVRIGGREASSVNRKSSKEITAKFCMDKILASKDDHIKTLSVQNPDTKRAKAKKAVNVDHIPFLTAENMNFDTNSVNGIKNIQMILYNNGLLDHGSVTGIMDLQTKNAIIAFQRMHGLPQTGFVGPLTIAQLREDAR